MLLYFGLSNRSCPRYLSVNGWAKWQSCGDGMRKGCRCDHLGATSVPVGRILGLRNQVRACININKYTSGLIVGLTDCWLPCCIYVHVSDGWFVCVKDQFWGWPRLWLTDKDVSGLVCNGEGGDVINMKLEIIGVWTTRQLLSRKLTHNTLTHFKVVMPRFVSCWRKPREHMRLLCTCVAESDNGNLWWKKSYSVIEKEDHKLILCND